MNSFQQRKLDVLSKNDKSHIGTWDEKIAGLCGKINSKENYYTTSSCSGRIVLMIDQEKKGEDLFLFVSHDKVSFKKLKDELEKISDNFVRSSPTRDLAQNSLPPAQREINLTSRNRSPTPKGKLKIKFKMEPCILHIACENLEDAEKLFEIGKNAGWKRLGIIGTSHGFTFELNSTEKLEFPIIQNKKILVDDNFLKIILEDANGKLEKCWMKIKKLEKEM